MRFVLPLIAAAFASVSQIANEGVLKRHHDSWRKKIDEATAEIALVKTFLGAVEKGKGKKKDDDIEKKKEDESNFDDHNGDDNMEERSSLLAKGGPR